MAEVHLVYSVVGPQVALAALAAIDHVSPDVLTNTAVFVNTANINDAYVYACLEDATEAVRTEVTGMLAKHGTPASAAYTDLILRPKHWHAFGTLDKISSAVRMQFPTTPN